MPSVSSVSVMYGMSTLFQALDHSTPPLPSKGDFEHHPRMPRLGQQCYLLGTRTKLLAFYPGTLIRALFGVSCLWIEVGLLFLLRVFWFCIFWVCVFLVENYKPCVAYRWQYTVYPSQIHVSLLKGYTHRLHYKLIGFAWDLAFWGWTANQAFYSVML